MQAGGQFYRENATHIELYETLREKVNRFNLTNDMFFGKVMEDKLACQDFIRILTGDRELSVKEVKSQYSIRNLVTHSVVLDVLAETGDGRLVCVEIHLEEDEDHIRRARFDLGCIDMSFLEKGRDYGEIPDVCMIYITEKDFLEGGRGIYRVEKVVCGMDKLAADGICEIYANLTVTPEDEEQAELLRFIVQSDSRHQTDAFPHLADKVTQLKEEKEGVHMICDVLVETREEGIELGRQEGRQEGLLEGEQLSLIRLVRRKIRKGYSAEQTAEALEEDPALIRKIYAASDGAADEYEAYRALLRMNHQPVDKSQHTVVD